MRKLLIVLPALAVLFSACSINNVTEDGSLQRFFDSAGVKGCFALYDNGQGKFTIYNLARYRDSVYAPGATFDIVELLVGLQTGRLSDEKQVLVVRDTLEVDTVNHTETRQHRPVPVTTTEAFRTTDEYNKAVFHKLAENIGYDSLKKWVDSLHYGNGAFDKDSNAIFDGSLRLPADQQLGLIKKLYFNQLPFFRRNQEIVRGMMQKESNTNYELVYKTAVVADGNHTLGWLLGWVVENKHPYFFVTNFDLQPGVADADAAALGIQLVKHILPSMGFFQGKNDPAGPLETGTLSRPGTRSTGDRSALNRRPGRFRHNVLYCRFVYRIEHTENLIGLAALPLLAVALWFLLGWKKRTVARVGDPSLVKQLISNFSSTRFLLKAGVVLLAFAIIVIGAGNPQKPGKMENVQRKGVDVMVVLDVSKSMLARDIKPSRLDKAKQLLLLMIDKLENDRVGLVLFAGRAYLQMPLTSDHGAARMYMQDASPDAVPTQGTVIAEALKMANTAFNSKERKYKSILLISDGEDHDPDALKAAKDLAKDGVMINTLGIGSPDGSPIVDPATGELKKDEQGNTVISKLNEAELQQIADAGNGQYLRLDNVDDALITMTQQLDSVEKKSMSDAEFVDYISYFQWFLGIGVLFLVFEYFFSERRPAAREKRVRNGAAANATGATSNAAGSGSAKRNIATAVLALAILVSAIPASAQSSTPQIRSGNRFYRKGQLDKSVQQYQQAVQQTPNNPTANYNLGNAQFKKNNFDEASHSYDATVQNSPDSAMKEKGYYNKGVAMIRQKKLQESIDAWKNALKLDPNDVEARENLEKALKEQKKQQQQQQQNQKDQKKDQKNQKDKKDDKKDQDQQQQQQQQPKPQPSRLNKQQVEQLLKALEQKENDLQNKMRQNKVKTPNQPEKDW